MSLLGGIIGGVKSVFSSKALVTFIDVDDKAEQRAAEGARWFLLLLGGGSAVYLIFKGLASVVQAFR